MGEVTHPPITTELRRLVRRYSRYGGLASKDGTPSIKCDEADFEAACDAIDAIHAALEEENDALRAELEACRPDSWEAIIRDAYMTGSRGEVIVVEPFEERCRALARGQR